jgi:hypothetical protein
LTKYWLEVLIVIVEGAGNKRSLPVPNSHYKMVTKEMIWSHNQTLITKHLQTVENTWDVKLVHGKREGKYWRDFIVCGKSFKTSLSNIARFGHEIDKITTDKLNQIWSYAESHQRLTRNYATIIYTDQSELYYTSSGKGNQLMARRDVVGLTVHKKDVKNLSKDICFIFPEAQLQTTAHELGHLIGGLPQSRVKGNIMSEASDEVRNADQKDKKAFYGSNYVSNDTRELERIQEIQDYKPSLLIYLPITIP